MNAMEQFVRKILIYVIVPLLLMLPVLFGFDYLVKKIAPSFKIPHDISNVFIGDSHIQCAINDSIVPHSINIAISAESFYFSYYKLERLLDENPSVKHVYLGFSYHSLSNYYDELTSGDFSSEIAPKYFSILPLKEQFRMLYWNRNSIAPFLKGIITHGIYQIWFKQYFPYIGGFSDYFKDTSADQLSMDKRLIFQFYNEGKVNDFSGLNISYLRKIIKLCKSKNVRLTVLKTPLHWYYFNKIPLIYKNKLGEILKSEKIDAIDLVNLKLSDECFIPDGDHVSFLGARKTSIQLRKIIQ